MLSALRSRALGRWHPLPHLLPRLLSSGSSSPARQAEFLELSEVERVLRDVRAGDVRVFPVGEGGRHGGACADYMVVATGRSDWHVRNIAQAILYKEKMAAARPQKGSVLSDFLEKPKSYLKRERSQPYFVASQASRGKVLHD